VLPVISPYRIHRRSQPPIAALPGLRIVIVGSVGTIGYQVDGFVALGVLRTVVELIMSKLVSRKEVDLGEPSLWN